METATSISQAQLEANQANALKSTGPKTEEGKAIARFNARRHGLTGQFYCMSEADELAYKSFEADMLGSLKPEGAYENQLAITITQDHWRLNRSRGVEFNLYGRGHDTLAEVIEAPTENSHAAATMADTYQADSRTFSNIALYETRIHRMIVKNEKRLTELRTERIAVETKAREQAKLLLRFAGSEAETNPQAAANAELNPTSELREPTTRVDGFVFSTPELIAEINLEERLKEADYYQKNGWSRNFPYRGNRSIHLKAA